MGDARVINYDVQINAYNKELMTPDRRFRSGERGTGKFKIETGVCIDITVEADSLAPVSMINDSFSLGSSEPIGTYRLISIDLAKNQAVLRSNYANIPATRLKLNSKIQLFHIGRFYREGSC